MIRLSRPAAVIGTTLALAVAFGCGSARGVANQGVSPCGTATAPTWSPDGTQIAWFGYRWPRPPHNHAVGSYNILRAICVSDATGKNLHQLPSTVCSERCSNALREGVGQLDWAQPNLLLAGMDTGIATVPLGQKPKLLAKTGPTRFSTDSSGDRVASGLFADGCSGCSGPVKVFSATGALVGQVGGAKHFNGDPSLSPDGTQVVFVRSSGKNPEAQPSIWTASADGSYLQRLEQKGTSPLWSPAGDRIAYLAPTGPTRWAWRLVAPQGGASTTLLRNAPGTVF